MLEIFNLRTRLAQKEQALAQAEQDRDSWKSKSKKLGKAYKALLADQFTSKSERARIRLQNTQNKPGKPQDAAPAPSSGSSEDSVDSAAADDETGGGSPQKDEKSSFRAVLDALPVDEIRVKEMTPPNCSICGTPMAILDYEVSRELVVKPAEVYVREWRTPVFVCRNCDQNGTVVPFIHARPDLVRPLPRCQAAPETLAWLLYQKCILGVPFYRLERFFEDLDLAISRTTMGNWMIAASERWLRMLVKRMEQELLKQPIIHHDETPFHVLNEPGRSRQSKGFAWIMASTFRDTPVRYVVLYYNQSRAARIPLEHLDDYQGWLVVDGYSGYRRLADMAEGVALSGCWAHARRMWHTAMKNAEPPPDDPIAVGFNFIQKIFRLEELFEDCPPDRRLRLRQRFLKPLLEEFRDWAQQQYSGATLLGKAVKYTLNQWPALEQVLNDGRLPITNAAAELVAKHFAVCRKNCLFADSPRGAHALMDAMSVVLTAKANGLRPFDYLTWIFTEMPVCMRNLEPTVADAMAAPAAALAERTEQAVAPVLAQGIRTPDSTAFPRLEVEAMVRAAFRQEIIDPTVSEILQMAEEECRQKMLTRFLPEFAPKPSTRTWSSEPDGAEQARPTSV